MVFRPAATFKNAGGPTGRSQGMAPIGAGAQRFTPNSSLDVTVFGPSTLDYVDPVPWYPKRPEKGRRTWGKPSAPTGGQQGFPGPQGAPQRRLKGEMDVYAPAYGENIEVWTPYYSRGAAAYVQNYGKVLYDPIGAGVVALQRPQASYGPAAQYADGSIWWTSQVIPTSINLQGLTTPQGLIDILNNVEVQAVYRTTG